MWFFSELQWCIDKVDNRGKCFFKVLEVDLLRGTHIPLGRVSAVQVTEAECVLKQACWVKVGWGGGLRSA